MRYPGQREGSASPRNSSTWGRAMSNPMLIRMSTILFAAAVALGLLFLTPAAGARPMKECSARYHAPAKATARTQCGANAPNVFSRRSPPRGITLGIGDVVSVTIFEAEAGGLFVPSEA